MATLFLCLTLTFSLSTPAQLVSAAGLDGKSVEIVDCAKCQDGESLGAGLQEQKGGAAPESEKPIGGVSQFIYLQRERVPACSANSPGDAAEICNNSSNCEDPLSTRYWLFERTVDVDRQRSPQEVAGPWRRLPGEPCLQRDEDAPTVDEVLAAVRSEFVRKRPAVPSVTVRPAPRVLITARNSFSAGSAEPVELTDTVLGRPIVITATPERWVWDFGDGTTRTTTTPGAPGTLEVAHAYDDAGDVRVQVTVEWSGTFTVGGFAGSFSIDGVARVASEPVVLQVREARTELVDR